MMTKQDMQNSVYSPPPQNPRPQKKNTWLLTLRGWAVDRMTNHWPSRQNQSRTVALRRRERKGKETKRTDCVTRFSSVSKIDGDIQQLGLAPSCCTTLVYLLCVYTRRRRRLELRTRRRRPARYLYANK